MIRLVQLPVFEWYLGSVITENNGNYEDMKSRTMVQTSVSTYYYKTC